MILTGKKVTVTIGVILILLQIVSYIGMTIADRDLFMDDYALLDTGIPFGYEKVEKSLNFKFSHAFSAFGYGVNRFFISFENFSQINDEYIFESLAEMYSDLLCGSYYHEWQVVAFNFFYGIGFYLCGIIGLVLIFIDPRYKELDDLNCFDNINSNVNND